MGRRKRSPSSSASPTARRKQPRLAAAAAEQPSPTPPLCSAPHGRLALVPAAPAAPASAPARSHRPAPPLRAPPPRRPRSQAPARPRRRRRSPSPPLSISSDLDLPAASTCFPRPRPGRPSRTLRAILSGSASDHEAIDSASSGADEPRPRRPSPLPHAPSSSPAADNGRNAGQRALFQLSWATAFSPAAIADLAVHPAKVAAIHGWMRDALLGPPSLRRLRRVLCVRGPAGSGKSVLLDALSREADLRLAPDASTFSSRIHRPGRSSKPPLPPRPLPSDQTCGFETVHFDAHSLPSSSRGMWGGGEAVHIAAAFPAFLHEAVRGRTLALVAPPDTRMETKPLPSSTVASSCRTRVPPRSPPSSGPPSCPHRALSLSPSGTRLPLSQLSALIDEEPSFANKARTFGPRSPWRRTQSTPLGIASDHGPPVSEDEGTDGNSRKQHTLIVVDDLPNLYHKATRDAFQAALLAFLEQPHEDANVPLVVLLSESAPQLGAAPEDGAGESAAASHAGAGLAWSDRLANLWDARSLLGDVRSHPAYADVQLNPASMTLLRQALRRIVDCALGFCAAEMGLTPSSSPVSGQDLARAEAHAGFSRVVGYTVADTLARSSLTGDVRGASIALQETLRAMVQDGLGRPLLPPSSSAPGDKRRPRAGTKAAVKLEEKEAQAQAEMGVKPVIEKVTARVAGLDLWHLVGKVLYNKQMRVLNLDPAPTPQRERDQAESLFCRVMRAKQALSSTTSTSRVLSCGSTGAFVPSSVWATPQWWTPAADPLRLWRGLTVSPADLSLFLLENSPRFTAVHEQTLDYARDRGLPIPENFDVPPPAAAVATAEYGAGWDSDATQPEESPDPPPPALFHSSKETGLLAASRIADALSLADAYFGSPAGGSGPGDAILIGGGKSLNPSPLLGIAMGAAEEYEFHTVVRGVTAHMPPYLGIGPDGRLVESSTEPTRYAKRPRDAPAAPKVRKPEWYAARREAQAAHADLRDALQPSPALPLATSYASDPFSWPLLSRLARGPRTFPILNLPSLWKLTLTCCAVTIRRTASIQRLATIREHSGDGSDSESLMPDDGRGGEADLPTAALFRSERAGELGCELGDHANNSQDAPGEFSDDAIEDAEGRTAAAVSGDTSEDEFEDAEWDAMAMALDHV